MPLPTTVASCLLLSQLPAAAGELEADDPCARGCGREHTCGELNVSFTCEVLSSGMGCNCDGCCLATEAMREAEAVLLFSTLALSFAVSVALLLVWHVLLAPRIPGTRSREDHIFLASSFVSFYPALTAPFFAVLAMRSVPVTDNERVMDAVASTAALRAVGISCGYMLYDTCYMLRHRQVRSPLMLMHHLLSVLVWPYAVLRGRALLLVLFFIITEATNVGQHMRMTLLKLGLKHTKTYFVVGVSWVFFFFFVRIVPGPYLFYKLCRGNYASYNTFDFSLMMATAPLPFMLNTYWFYLLVRGLIGFLGESRESRVAKAQ